MGGKRAIVGIAPGCCSLLDPCRACMCQGGGEGGKRAIVGLAPGCCSLPGMCQDGERGSAALWAELRLLLLSEPGRLAMI